MKQLSLALAALVTLGLASSCTYVSQPREGGGRVIISAQAAHRGPSVTPALRSATNREVSPRRLSAADHILAIHYQVIDLSEDTVYDSGTVDLSYLYLELYLTPGNSYRIEVDVELDPASSYPGKATGVTRYGDQAEFWVNDYYDTVVNLTVHPTNTLVFDTRSVVGSSPATIDVLDPQATTPALEQRDFYAGTLTVDPADRVFYGPEGLLYYFNKAKNAVYRWANVTGTLSDADIVLSGEAAAPKGSLFSQDVALAAVCADPTAEGTLWLVGKDSIDDNWYYCKVVFDAGDGTPSLEYTSLSLTALLEDGLSSAAAIVVPTGIAVDSTWNDVYITYYATNGLDDAQSGLLQFWGDSLEGWFPDSTTVGVDTDSIYTDVLWDQGKVWLLASPNTSLADLTANTGTANLLVFDDFLYPLESPITSGTTYSGALPSLGGTTSLVLPQRLLAPIQGRTLYFGQADFADGSAGVVSSLDLDSLEIVTF